LPSVTVRRHREDDDVARSRGAAGTIGGVQEIELYLVVAAVLGIIAVAALRARAKFAEKPFALGALLGVVPGILGAVVVLVPRTDLVPDAVEPLIWAAIALTALGIALLALSSGLVRR
jgi:hypothetical protein